MFTNASAFGLSEPTFGLVDYIVFSLFLCISGAIGIFFSIRGQRNTNEYFFGSKKMPPVPVGISAGVSFMSSASLVGSPAEVYINGYTYMIASASGALGFFLGSVTVASTLQPLRINSVNEYIAKRFGSKLLTYAANIVVLLCILQYMGVCMLGSVIAFSSATGGQVSAVLALVIGGAVGIFYTSIGGLKAVVWTDVIQSLVMISGIIAVIVKSILDTPGGLSEIWRLNLRYERIHEPVWTFNPTIRHTIWGLLIGYSIYFFSFSIQPANVQRLCSARTTKDSYIVAAVSAVLFLIFDLLPSWAGLNIFAYYVSRGCDVHAAGWVKNNEIILYFVRERLNFPGFQGLFLAALYAGSLSSLSSGLNASSVVLWKDTIKPLLKVEVSELKATLFSKIIVVVFGVVSMLWCYALYEIGGLIIQMGVTINASMYGSYFGLFLVALLFRYVNYKGAFAGAFSSFIFMLALGLASIFYGGSTVAQLPTAKHNCTAASTNITYDNSTIVVAPVNPQTAKCESFIETILSLSYEWLPLLCVFVFLCVSLSVTGCTGFAEMQELDEELLFSPCRRVRLSRGGRGNSRDGLDPEVGEKEEAMKMCETEDDANARE